MEDDGHWNGVEDTIQDPEELRVLFCALDSFVFVRRYLLWWIFSVTLPYSTPRSTDIEDSCEVSCID
jgi:hypothetical protein